jgi:hypothetical protein
LVKAYATGDQNLNNHIFGNIPLKYIDFTSPEIYKMFRGIKKPKGKKEVYEYQLEKLRIMLEFYTPQEFE